MNKLGNSVTKLTHGLAHPPVSVIFLRGKREERGTSVIIELEPLILSTIDLTQVNEDGFQPKTYKLKKEGADIEIRFSPTFHFLPPSSISINLGDSLSGKATISIEDPSELLLKRINLDTKIESEASGIYASEKVKEDSFKNIRDELRIIQEFMKDIYDSPYYELLKQMFPTSLLYINEEDSETSIMLTPHPKIDINTLVFIDIAAQNGEWNRFFSGIVRTYEYSYQVQSGLKWNFNVLSLQNYLGSLPFTSNLYTNYGYAPFLERFNYLPFEISQILLSMIVAQYPPFVLHMLEIIGGEYIEKYLPLPHLLDLIVLTGNIRSGSVLLPTWEELKKEYEAYAIANNTNTKELTDLFGFLESEKNEENIKKKISGFDNKFKFLLPLVSAVFSYASVYKQKSKENLKEGGRNNLESFVDFYDDCINKYNYYVKRYSPLIFLNELGGLYYTPYKVRCGTRDITRDLSVNDEGKWIDDLVSSMEEEKMVLSSKEVQQPIIVNYDKTDNLFYSLFGSRKEVLSISETEKMELSKFVDSYRSPAFILDENVVKLGAIPKDPKANPEDYNSFVKVINELTFSTNRLAWKATIPTIKGLFDITRNYSPIKSIFEKMKTSVFMTFFEHPSGSCYAAMPKTRKYILGEVFGTIENNISPLKPFSTDILLMGFDDGLKSLSVVKDANSLATVFYYSPGMDYIETTSSNYMPFYLSSVFASPENIFKYGYNQVSSPQIFMPFIMYNEELFSKEKENYMGFINYIKHIEGISGELVTVSSKEEERGSKRSMSFPPIIELYKVLGYVISKGWLYVSNMRQFQAQLDYSIYNPLAAYSIGQLVLTKQTEWLYWITSFNFQLSSSGKSVSFNMNGTFGIPLNELYLLPDLMPWETLKIIASFLDKFYIKKLKAKPVSTMVKNRHKVNKVGFLERAIARATYIYLLNNFSTIFKEAVSFKHTDSWGKKLTSFMNLHSIEVHTDMSKKELVMSFVWGETVNTGDALNPRYSLIGRDPFLINVKIPLDMGDVLEKHQVESKTSTPIVSFCLSNLKFNIEVYDFTPYINSAYEHWINDQVKGNKYRYKEFIYSLADSSMEGIKNIGDSVIFIKERGITPVFTKCKYIIKGERKETEVDGFSVITKDKLNFSGLGVSKDTTSPVLIETNVSSSTKSVTTDYIYTGFYYNVNKKIENVAFKHIQEVIYSDVVSGVFYHNLTYPNVVENKFPIILRKSEVFSREFPQILLLSILYEVKSILGDSLKDYLRYVGYNCEQNQRMWYVHPTDTFGNLDIVTSPCGALPPLPQESAPSPESTTESASGGIPLSLLKKLVLFEVSPQSRSELSNIGRLVIDKNPDGSYGATFENSKAITTQKFETETIGQIYPYYPSPEYRTFTLPKDFINENSTKYLLYYMEKLDKIDCVYFKERFVDKNVQEAFLKEFYEFSRLENYEKWIKEFINYSFTYTPDISISISGETSFCIKNSMDLFIAINEKNGNGGGFVVTAKPIGAYRSLFERDGNDLEFLKKDIDNIFITFSMNLYEKLINSDRKSGGEKAISKPTGKADESIITKGISK